MKIPLLTAALILAIGLLWGWRGSHHLSRLRETEKSVIREAAALGLSTNPDQPRAPTKHSRRERERDSENIRQIYDQILSQRKRAKERVDAATKPTDAEIDEETALHERLHSLSGPDTLELISLIRKNADLSIEDSNSFEFEMMTLLASKAPELALNDILAQTEKNGGTFLHFNLIQVALSHHANDNPVEAVAWLKKHAEKFPYLINDQAKHSLLGSIAQKDPFLALSFLSEISPSDAGSTLSVIVQYAKTPEQQLMMLEHLRTMEKSGDSNNQIRSSKDALYSQVAESGFDAAQSWMKSANLTPDETQNLAAFLHYRQTQQDTGKWLDWVEKSKPVDSSYLSNIAKRLVTDWTENDYLAAGQWLVEAKDGPLKEAAVDSYIRTIAPYDPETATQWAETLPEKKRKPAYEAIHRKIKDPAAAAAYAETHGLKK
ncbi:MAG: hypothetical protein QM627_10790 [Luteolibacter sp.]